MRKLEPHNQISLTRQSLARILGAYSFSDFSFEPINQGIENTSVFIENARKKYVLRICAQERKSDDDIIFEINFQDYLRAQGIPIPLLYPNKEGKELTITEVDGKRWRSVLMQFVEGQSVTPHTTPELIWSH